KPNDYKSRPAGFPRFQPAKLIPCDPSFIGLPAPQADINDSERLRKVVLSLKSWLGQSARFVKLQKEIGLQEDGQFVQKSSIPLDDLMESAFAALAEAYLIPHLEDNKLEVHQIVLCHPNTFTQVHKERLQNIAYRALSDRLKIDNPKHIHLISESDAVAYSYCLQKKKEGKNEGTERIMIYDFGAGTLDISVIKFKWNKNANYPEKWITESRIGVPVAGNYLDKMLACLIDSSLKKLLADTQYQDKFDYQYPVVAETLKPEKTNEHRRAIQELWAAVKEAKQVWKQGQPFIVKVGEEQSLIGILKVKDIKGGYPTERPEINKLGLWGDGTYLRLAIPPSIVNEDKNFKEFIKFITHTVPAEAIKIAKNTARKAGGSKQNVETDSLQWKLDKIVLSGRGALWPGLQGYLEEEFDISAALIIGDKSSLNENEASNGMKEAVARGAIAWPTVEKDIEKLDLASPQLAVLIANKTNIVFIGEGSEKVKGTEKNNGKGVEYEPIDLKGSPNFNLVQVAVADPNPREDINDKFRRYFYIELSDHHYKRDIYWKEDPRLYIEQKEEDGHKEILLKNYDGYTISAFSSDFRAEQPTDEPSWPIGSPVINPNGQ
ncbi:MAG: Hsp70 family protein, partial [Blastocatellia bacterium]|nr:Hsp70 family protein [Blastocatellia bacterium]